MFDAAARKVIDPLLTVPSRALVQLGVGANTVTLVGLALGVIAAGVVALGEPVWALVPILLNRLADGLDGAVARVNGNTGFGGYLDISADFLFYGMVPMAFVWLDPATNGMAGAFLLTSICFNCATFLGFAILTEKRRMQTETRGVKSFHYNGGLLEGTETIVFFVALCLWPDWFAPMAWIFGALCLVTAASRILLARRAFADRESTG